MGRANLAQALQVAHRRNDHARRAGKRLHDHGGNVAGVVQVDEVQQVVGQRRPLPARAVGLGRRHALEERARWRLGVRQVVGLHALAKQLAVAHDAAHRNAAKVHAVVTLHAANQPGFLAHALGAPVGAGHFQRRVGRLGARAREEHMAQARWHALHHPVGQFERQRVAKLEGGRVVQRAHLLRHGAGDFFAPVAQARAPQARQAVKNGLAVHVGEIRALGAGHQPGLGLELAVAGVGHPVRVQPSGVGASGVGRVGGGQVGVVVQVHGGLRRAWGGGRLGVGLGWAVRGGRIVGRLLCALKFK